MGEMRTIEFLTTRAFDIGANENRITEMSSGDKHVAMVSHALPDYAVVSCSCAPESVWKISRARATDAEIQGTFNAHLCYFDRPKMVTL